MKKKLVLVGLLLAVAGAAAWIVYDRLQQPNVLRLPGIVEIQEVRLGSKVGGRVARLLVGEGETVTPGQQLLTFDAPELENQRTQLEANLKAAQADLDRAVAGPRDEEKRAAQAMLDSAKARYDRVVFGWREEEKRQAAGEMETADAELKRATREYDRLRNLVRMNSAAQVDFDNALGGRDRALGMFNAAKAKNEMMQLGSRKEDVAEARAEWEKAQAKVDELQNGTRKEDLALVYSKLEHAKAKLEEVEVNLRETVVSVPKELGKAVVEVIAVRPGDLVPAGQPVVRVLRVGDLWVKIFVPETELGRVPLKQEVEIRIDAYSRKKFRGVVMQKASVSEFTPRNVQSVDERRYQVFAVKIRVDDPQGVFNAGMAAEVVIPLE